MASVRTTHVTLSEDRVIFEGTAIVTDMVLANETDNAVSIQFINSLAEVVLLMVCPVRDQRRVSGQWLTEGLTALGVGSSQVHLTVFHTQESA